MEYKKNEYTSCQRNREKHFLPLKTMETHHQNICKMLFEWKQKSVNEL